MSTYPCSGGSPGTVQYDACHAADQQTIADLRAQLAEAQADLLRSQRLFEQLIADERAARQQAEVRCLGLDERLGLLMGENDTLRRARSDEELARKQAEREPLELKRKAFAERDRAVEALREYGKHRMQCPMNPYNNPDETTECNCGLDDALRETGGS